MSPARVQVGLLLAPATDHLAPVSLAIFWASLTFVARGVVLLAVAPSLGSPLARLDAFGSPKRRPFTVRRGPGYRQRRPITASALSA
jgi:hypothetical protein